MKRLLTLCVALMAISAAASAQDDVFKGLAKKYDKISGYEVATVGRAAIRMAALTSGDKYSRELMRKLSLLVSVSHKGETKGELRGDFSRLVEGYDAVGEFRQESIEALMYMNPECTGFAMYSHSPDGESVLLLVGENLSITDLLPKELQSKVKGE